MIREYEPASIEAGMMADEVREAVLRGVEVPDDFSTRPAQELQAILHDTPTLALETLLNHGGVEIDYNNRRIWRDSFWKGSFAKDSLLGWEERVRNSALAAATGTASLYAGGSFWKRFDSIQDGQAIGYVVNYELTSLPGKPVVKRIAYPDNNRKYFRAGDDVLLLNYTNDPYRLVYDTIKAIDKNNCIGVMHLGSSPMALSSPASSWPGTTTRLRRWQCPIIRRSSMATMSACLHQRISRAHGVHLIFLTRPDVSLLNQLNPVAFRLRFIPTTNGVEGRYQFGIISGQMQVQFTSEFVRLIDFTSFHDEIRMIDPKTMIGKWVSPAAPEWIKNTALAGALNGFLEAGRIGLPFTIF